MPVSPPPPGYALLYDAATGTTAPRSALLLAAGLAGVAALRMAWRTRRGQRALDGLAGLLGVGALLFAACAGAFAYERRQLARGEVALQVVEGPITDVWHDRTVRDGRTRASWEGFRVAGVPFVHELSSEDNYWRNRPWQGGPLGEGARVRLHYVERVSDGRARRYIVRAERALP